MPELTSALVSACKLDAVAYMAAFFRGAFNIAVMPHIGRTS